MKSQKRLREGWAIVAYERNSEYYGRIRQEGETVGTGKLEWRIFVMVMVDTWRSIAGASQVPHHINVVRRTAHCCLRPCKHGNNHELGSATSDNTA